jgi:hypothetical protein
VTIKARLFMLCRIVPVELLSLTRWDGDGMFIVADPLQQNMNRVLYARAVRGKR